MIVNLNPPDVHQMQIVSIWQLFNCTHDLHKDNEQFLDDAVFRGFPGESVESFITTI